MPYYNNDDLLRYFTKYINGKADKEIEVLKEEIEEEKERSLKRIDHELANSASRSLDIELSELNSDFAGRMNRVKTERSKVLKEKRSKLLSSIVDEVESKLMSFHKSKEYEKAMIQQVKKLQSGFCSDKIEFRVMKNDATIKKVIETHYKGSFEIKEISEIEFGGFSALCFKMGIMTDQTIDTRLEQKKQWLYEHSKLAASQ